MNAVAEAAAALVGVPFRLHGRDPASGLDCVGLVAAALEKAGTVVDLPCDYALRMRSLDRFGDVAGRCDFVPAAGAREAGDVLLFRLGAWQHHLAIAAAAGEVIHAHAGLRRVVLAPVPADWALAGHWRHPAF